MAIEEQLAILMAKAELADQIIALIRNAGAVARVKPGPKPATGPKKKKRKYTSRLGRRARANGGAETAPPRPKAAVPPSGDVGGLDVTT